MAVVAFMSAKGSPGTTTTAQLLAALWPRPVLLVDADTDGGDIALRLLREDGAPVDRNRGLLSLLALARREMSPSVLVEHAQVLRGGTELISGLAGPDQAGAAQLLWDNLGRAFAGSTTHDVLLDCGRVSSASPHLQLVQHADLLLSVLRPTVSGIIHTRERLTDLSRVLGSGGPAPRVRVIVIGDGKKDRDVSGAATLLQRDLPGVEVVGVLADDAEGASVLSGLELSRPERTLLVRSAHPVVAAVAALAGVVPEPGQAGHVPPQATDGQDGTAGPDRVPPSAPQRRGRRAAKREKKGRRARRTEQTAAGGNTLPAPGTPALEDYVAAAAAPPPPPAGTAP